MNNHSWQRGPNPLFYETPSILPTPPSPVCRALIHIDVRFMQQDIMFTDV